MYKLKTQRIISIRKEGCHTLLINYLLHIQSIHFPFKNILRKKNTYI